MEKYKNILKFVKKSIYFKNKIDKNVRFSYTIMDCLSVLH